MESVQRRAKKMVEKNVQANNLGALCKIRYDNDIYTPVSLKSTFGYINFHLYQHVFLPRFSPMSHYLDLVISRFIYINVHNMNRQADISETKV